MKLSFIKLWSVGLCLLSGAYFFPPQKHAQASQDNPLNIQAYKNFPPIPGLDYQQVRFFKGIGTFIGTKGHGLWQYNQKTDTFELFDLPGVNSKTLTVFNLYFDRDAMLWIVTDQGTFFRTDNGHIALLFEYFYNITSMYETQRHIYIACSSGPISYKGSLLEILSHSFFGLEWKIDTISTVFEDSHKTVWVAGHDLWRSDDGGKNFYRAINLGLNNRYITSMVEDSEHVLWFSGGNNVNGGLFYSKTFGDDFHNIPINGNNNILIHHLWIGENSTLLFIATQYHGLIYFDFLQPEYQFVQVMTPIYQDWEINDVYQMPIINSASENHFSDYLWICVVHYGLWYSQMNEIKIY